MIGSINAEWRKLARRPTDLIAVVGLLAVVALIYSVGYIEYTWPAAGQAARALLLKQGLYPGGLVKNLIDGAMPLGAAMAIVLGALATGGEYGWGTMKTVLTQGPGRLQTLVAKLVAAGFGTAVLTALFYAAGAIASLIVAGVDGHAVAWPSAIDIIKALGATWLILYLYGLFGMALGLLFRQSAAAVGVGLIYLVVVETILARFITGFHGATTSGWSRACRGPTPPPWFSPLVKYWLTRRHHRRWWASLRSYGVPSSHACDGFASSAAELPLQAASVRRAPRTCIAVTTARTRC